MSILDGFTLDDIEYLINLNPSMRGYVQGYLAELMLTRQIANMAGVTAVTKIPDRADRKGDLEVIYLGVPITIECKSILSNTVVQDELNDSWSGIVTIKNNGWREHVVKGESHRISSLQKGGFDILALSCYAVDGEWTFQFIEEKYLPEHHSLPGFISTKFRINPHTTAGVTENLAALFDKIVAQKSMITC